MTRHEKITMAMSFIALAVSLSTTAYDRISAHEADVKTDSKKLYTAYSFGEKVVEAYIWRMQPATPEQKGQVTVESALQLDNAQRLGESLNPNIDIKKAFETLGVSTWVKPGEGLLFDGERQIETLVGRREAAAYDLGVSLLWTSFNANAMSETSEAETDSMQSYRPWRDTINADLQLLGVKEQMPPFADRSIIADSSTRIRHNLRNLWSY